MAKKDETEKKLSKALKGAALDRVPLGTVQPTWQKLEKILKRAKDNEQSD